MHTRKFFIKTLVRNEYILNVHISEFEEDVTISEMMAGSTTSLRRRTILWGRTGCLRKVFVKNATSFSPSFSLASRTMTTLSWIGNVALVCSSSLYFSMFYFLLYLLHFPLISMISPYFIWCFKRFRHCVPLHSMPYCDTQIGHRHLQGTPIPHAGFWAEAQFSAGCPTLGVRFCSSEDGKAQFQFVVCVSSLFDF